MPQETPSRAASRYGWTRTVLLLGPLLMLVAGTYFLRNTDPDYWWHVRTGQVIVDTRSVPEVDIFSYTVAGQPWIAHEWLAKVYFYLVERTLGYWANVLTFALLAALTLLLIYWTARLRGLGELGAALVGLLGVLVGLASANVRPQMFSVFLLAVTVLILTHAKSRGSTRSLWFLPAVFLLWANLHGGFVIGLAVLWLAVVGETIEHRRNGVGVPLRPLIGSAVLSSAVVLVNPYGVDTITYALSFGSSENASMRWIKEWQSPDFHAPWFLVLAGLLLATMVVGLWGVPLGITEVLWGILLAFLALRSVRHIPLYVVVILPLLGARLATWWPMLRKPLTGWRSPVPLLALWVPFLVLLPVSLSRVAQGQLVLQVGKAPSALGYPASGVDYLLAHDLQGNLFNEYAWGGYLIYRLYPHRLVFVDGSRADVYGSDLMAAYGKVAGVQPGWREVLDRYEVQVVLLPKDSPPAELLAATGEWEKAFEGDVEVVFVRRDAEVNGR